MAVDALWVRGACMKAVLARAAARRGDRAAAVAHWQSGAATAMKDHAHLIALQIGRQCGGEEGRRIEDAACAAMGRERQIVVAELEAAGASLGADEWPAPIAAQLVPAFHKRPQKAAPGAGPSRTPAPPPGQPPVTRAARPSAPGRRVVG